MHSTLLHSWLKWLRPAPRPLGQRGEQYAARWLRRRGYKIVAGGHRTRHGEIDIVAVLGETIVFVEVKTRRSRELGDAAEAVDAQKQRHFAHAALGFLKEHGLLEYPVRFDVIAIVWPPGARTPELLHLPSAFEPSDFGQFFS